VFRNDQISLDEARRFDPDAIVISPGPGNPESPRDFGACSLILREMGKDVPTLGVCLGHQGIGSVFGGRITHAKSLLHGKTSLVSHDGRTVFEGLPNPFVAGRYHSLAVDPASLPDVLEVSAKAEDGEIMALRHRRYPIEGLQFHPESILTPEGPKILRNFLKGARR